MEYVVVNLVPVRKLIHCLILILSECKFHSANFLGLRKYFLLFHFEQKSFLERCCCRKHSMPRLTKRLVVEKDNYITTVGTSSLTCLSPCYSFLPHMVLTNCAGTLSSPGEINMKSFQQAQMPHDLSEPWPWLEAIIY